MQKISQALLALDHLYRDTSLAAYEQARQSLEEHIQQVLPGFTVASAVEIGTAGAGVEEYQHGGVAHVLLPLQKNLLIVW